MKVTVHFEQPGAKPAAVFEMMTDRAFQEQKCVETGALNYTVEIDGAHVRTLRQMPADGLPDYVKNLVRDGIRVQEQFDWSEPDSGGGRVARMDVRFLGQPLVMTGTLRIDPAGAGTVVLLDGDLKAGIPILGAKIEAAAEPLIKQAMRIERDLGRRWLAAG
ncbi:MAG: DUF2505 domain-containing protein [Actinobacteria bacterium]|nr:DUF2505 domain-containing protein [Actinomycetota bacterium]